MKTDTKHDCPGYCGRRVNRSMLACRDCWGRLPEHLRTNLLKADAGRRREPHDPLRISHHRNALTACLTWYRDNLPGESRAES